MNLTRVEWMLVARSLRQREQSERKSNPGEGGRCRVLAERIEAHLIGKEHAA